MRENKQIIIGYVLALVAVLSWGANAVIVRFLSEQTVNTELIATLRLFIGSFVLILVSWFLRFVRRNQNNATMFQVKYDGFFWLTVVGLALNFIFFHRGLSLTFASNALLIETFAPVFVLLLIIFVFPHRIPFLTRKANLVSRLLFIVTIASVGSSLLLLNKPYDPTLNFETKHLGDFLEFLAMIFFALFFIGSNEYKKNHMKKSSITVTAHFLFFSGLIVALSLPFFSDLSSVFNISLAQWAWIAFLGVLPTGISYFLWHHASKYLRVVSLTLLFNLSAIFAVIFENIFLRTSITWQTVAAAVMIISASILAELTYREGLKGEKPHVADLA